MNIKKIIGTFMAVMGLGAAVAAPSMAQQQTFATVSGSGAPSAQSQVFTYTGGSTGAFTTTAGSIFTSTSFPFSDSNDTMSFTGFSASGMATVGATPTSIVQGLGGGTFTLRSSTNMILLSGSFGGGNILTADSTGSTGSITTTVNSVTYDPSTYFTASGLKNQGSFSISMTSIAPAPSIVNGYLSGFKAGGTSTFSATAPTSTPEPATLATFALGGLGLLGLIARKTRRTGGMAA